MNLKLLQCSDLKILSSKKVTQIVWNQGSASPQKNRDKEENIETNKEE